MVEIQAPAVGAKVDSDKPLASIGSVGKGLVTAFLTISLFAGGQYAYNKVAENTPDEISRATVV